MPRHLDLAKNRRTPTGPGSVLTLGLTLLWAGACGENLAQSSTNDAGRDASASIIPDARRESAPADATLRRTDAEKASVDADPGATRVQPAVEIGSVAANLDQHGGVAETNTKAVRLEFPEEALSRAVEITAEPAKSFPEDASLVPGAVVDFGPDGIVFDKPVVVTLAYDPARLPAGFDESSLRLYKAVDGAWKLLENSRVDLERKVVVAELGGFSVYGVRGGCAPRCTEGSCGGDDGCGGICPACAPQAGCAAPTDCPPGSRCVDGHCMVYSQGSGVGTLQGSVGEAGSRLQSDTGVLTLQVPAGALSRTLTLTAEPLASFPADRRILSDRVVDFGPDGATFGKPVSVTISYAQATLPQWASEADLRLFKLVGQGWQQVDSSRVDTATKVVTAQLSSFSSYAVGTALVGGSCVAGPEVCDGVDNDCDAEVDEGCQESCRGGVCKSIPAFCRDQQTNGDEEGRDCGGSCFACECGAQRGACPAGLVCASGLCCKDADGDGILPPPCGSDADDGNAAVGRACTADSECAPGEMCANGRCVAASRY